MNFPLYRYSYSYSYSFAAPSKKTAFFTFPFYSLLSPDTVFFQCLNEEMVFRGLLLTVVMQHFGMRAAVVLAAGFALAHLLFYACNSVPENRGFISPVALATLFFFALTCQTLFFYTQCCSSTCSTFWLEFQPLYL